MKKLAFLTLAIVAAAGCSTSGDAPEASSASPVALPTDGVTPAPLQAF